MISFKLLSGIVPGDGGGAIGGTNTSLVEGRRDIDTGKIEMTLTLCRARHLSSGLMFTDATRGGTHRCSSTRVQA